jgi:hypothetical protein
MTNLRKTFILLSAAITMGKLARARAAAEKPAPPAGSKAKVASAKQTVGRGRVGKQLRPRASAAA